MNIKMILVLVPAFSIVACQSGETTKETESGEKKEEMVVEEPKQEEDNVSFETLTFPSEDGLEITADLYHASTEGPAVVLCHQAGWSRGEYIETAKKLQERGYNCLAVDQRSGGGVNDVENETFKRAKAAGKATEFLDAEQDIVAAVNFMSERYGKSVILIGSSYSAALSLKVTVENENVRAVMSFSPGEYFGANLKVGEAISGLKKPTFITSSKRESPQAGKLAEAVDPASITHFIPEANGDHGSRALWSEKTFSEEYWAAVNAFLEKID